MNSEFVKGLCKIISDFSLIVVLAFFISWAFLSRVIMQGFSMNPVIKDRDVVLVNRLYKNIIPLSRYDIVAFNIDGQDNIKRIIGLPGDFIKISSGNIYVNLNRIEEDFMQDSLSTSIDNEVYVNSNEYYVLGDNLDSSKDSRFKDVGNINKNSIIGKVWRVIGTRWIFNGFQDILLKQGEIYY